MGALSYFSPTAGRAGWEALRHHQHLTVGSVPYYVDLLAKPRFVQTNFPLAVLKEVLTNDAVAHVGHIAGPKKYSNAHPRTYSERFFGFVVRPRAAAATVAQRGGTNDDSSLVESKKVNTFTLLSANDERRTPMRAFWDPVAYPLTGPNAYDAPARRRSAAMAEVERAMNPDAIDFREYVRFFRFRGVRRAMRSSAMFRGGATPGVGGGGDFSPSESRR